MRRILFISSMLAGSLSSVAPENSSLVERPTPDPARLNRKGVEGVGRGLTPRGPVSILPVGAIV